MSVSAKMNSKSHILITKEDNTYKEYSCGKASNGIDYGVKLCIIGSYAYLYGQVNKTMNANSTNNIGFIPSRFLPIRLTVFDTVSVLTNNENRTPSGKEVSLLVDEITGEIKLSSSEAFSNGLICFRVFFPSEMLASN